MGTRGISLATHFFALIHVPAMVGGLSALFHLNLGFVALINLLKWYPQLCTLDSRSARPHRQECRRRGRAASGARRRGSTSLIWALGAAKTLCPFPPRHLEVGIRRTVKFRRCSTGSTRNRNSSTAAPPEFEGGLNGTCSRLGRAPSAKAVCRAALRQFEGRANCLGATLLLPPRRAVVRRPRSLLDIRASADPWMTTRNALQRGEGGEPRLRVLPRPNALTLFGDASRNDLARGWGPPPAAARPSRPPPPMLLPERPIMVSLTIPPARAAG